MRTQPAAAAAEPSAWFWCSDGWVDIWAGIAVRLPPPGSAAALVQAALLPGSSVNFPQITEICERAAAEPCELEGAVWFLVGALRDGYADLRKKLKALTISNEMMYDEAAVAIFRASPGLPEALERLRGTKNTGLGAAVDDNIRMLATEVDRICFSEGGRPRARAGQLQKLGRSLKFGVGAAADKFRKPDAIGPTGAEGPCRDKAPQKLAAGIVPPLSVPVLVPSAAAAPPPAAMWLASEPPGCSQSACGTPLPGGPPPPCMVPPALESLLAAAPGPAAAASVPPQQPNAASQEAATAAAIDAAVTAAAGADDGPSVDATVLGGAFDVGSFSGPLDWGPDSADLAAAFSVGAHTSAPSPPWGAALADGSSPAEPAGKKGLDSLFD